MVKMNSLGVLEVLSIKKCVHCA